MKVLIEINCDNAAFGDDPNFELNRILTLIAKWVYDFGIEDSESPLFDINGNKVGFLKVEK